MFEEYYTPESLIEAARWLSADPRRKALAGGTSILPALKRNPGALGGRWADLSGLAELKTWSLNDDGGLRLGAGLTLNELNHLKIAASETNPLFQAARASAGPQIRNQATLGGNLLAPGNTDLGGPLLALGGRLALFGPSGEREILFKDFLNQLPAQPKCPIYGCGGFKTEKCPPQNAGGLPFTGKHGHPLSEVETRAVLKTGEFISAIILPPNKLNWFYQRYAAREALDFPTASVSLGVLVAKGCLAEVRLGLVGIQGGPRLIENTMKTAPGLTIKDIGEIELLLKNELLSFPRQRPCQEFRNHILMTLSSRILRQIGETA